jgi:glycosyltransferase involved in cell wall biosynthesis
MTPGLPAPPAVPFKAAISRLLARLVSRHVDWIYGCSAAVLTAHQWNGWQGCPSSVIYNGIDAKQLCPTTDRTSAKAAFGIGAGDLVIGSVGSLCPQKGQSCLIRAFARIRSSIPNTCLLIVGSGPDAAVLARLAQQTGCADAVHFVGEHANVAECFHAMDVFAFPSLGEGFGLALAEAMACGVPVVASAVGGVPELVTDGASGLLVPPADPEALAAAILRILDEPDLAAGLSTTALRVISDNFSVERMAAQVSELYARLLQQ